MSSSRWLALPLLLLVLGLAAPASAAPDAPSEEAFLTELSAPPCLAEAQTASVPELTLQVPEPQKRVIYPDCGVFCSDSRCSGQRTGGACTTTSGAPGWCKGINQVCSGEPAHSPCVCTAFP